MNHPLPADAELPRYGAIDPASIEADLDQLLASNRAAIEALLAEPGPATWERLCAPLEELEDDLERFWAPISHLNSVNNSEPLRHAYNVCLPKLSAWRSWLGQHRALYEAFQAVAKEDPSVDAVPGRRRALDNALRDFALAGVALEPAQRDRFAELSQHLATLSARFSDNLLDATDAWSLTVDEARLAGLPGSTRAAARRNADAAGESGYRLALDGPTYLAVMAHGEDRDLRKAFYTAWQTRASDQGPHAGQWDNSTVMHEILDSRRELADLLGFANYAELSLATKMAPDTASVIAFLEDLAARARPQAEAEWDALCAFAREHDGTTQLEAWDVPYYSEQLRQARYAISQEDLRPYLPLPRVLEALFSLCGELFGIEFRPGEAFDSYHPDLVLYAIYRDGELLAHCYLDLYARSGKRGGAWMGDCRVRREGVHGLQRPVAWLVCNFSPPEDGRPSLLTHDELTTLFHEFGHGLHHLLTRQTVAAVSGINGVEWDAVELPSQFLENWCWEAGFLARLGRHVDSGEAIPQALVERLLAARRFQAAMQTVRQLEFALFDFRLHLVWKHAEETPVETVLEAVRREVAVVHPPAWNRFQHGFGHIFAGGYAAGYYSYKWAEVLSADAYARFEEEGIFNGETGRAFLREVLEMGGSRDAMATFLAFRGRAPDIEPLLRHSGIAA
ncbi:M3 family metallopeptidase [Pseudohaliea rubra]|uniref:oligopeptidase A n=1 Tax=Pseudohaliea rubra DSM 19751 TaxID=1265313 RepID=A0A095VV98_9GAMM|nr:M3 family metallopeptidase [Pseudohaliea rubra]KGE05285.1 Oligopeptidase A [Pseudohaliea rubra DSM 19751]